MVVICTYILALFIHIYCYTYNAYNINNNNSGNFIMLSHWKTRPPAPWPDIALSHIILTLNQLVFALS